jgi:hypothetical protein
MQKLCEKPVYRSDDRQIIACWASVRPSKRKVRRISEGFTVVRARRTFGAATPPSANNLDRANPCHRS